LAMRNGMPHYRVLINNRHHDIFLESPYTTCNLGRSIVHIVRIDPQCAQALRETFSAFLGGVL